jgi:hypothetical protein
MPLQEERNLLRMVFMLTWTCIIICNEKLQMPLEEERNLLMVVFRLWVVFTVLRRQITRMAKYWNFV